MTSNICKICGKELSVNEKTISTSGCAISQSHRLAAYCNGPLHAECIAKWPDRLEFSKACFEQRYERYLKNGWHVLALRDDWFAGFIPPKPDTPPPEGMEDLVEVRIIDWPFALYGHAERWTEFFLGRWQEFLPALPGKAMIRAAMVVREIQQVLPDTNTIVEVINEKLLKK